MKRFVDFGPSLTTTKADRSIIIYNGRRTVATACAAMPSPRPVKPRRSVVVAFTLTRSAAIPRIVSNPLDHRRAMRADLRPLADDRHVDRSNSAAPRADEIGRVA